MPKRTFQLPSYRRHKVSLSGKDNYLGEWQSELNKTEYNCLLGEWMSTSRHR